MNLVRRYPNEEVRRLPFEFEDRLGKYLDAAPDVFPMSGAPPEQPRFVFNGGKKNLAVSNISTQLTLAFDSVPKDGIFPVIKRACFEMNKVNDIFANQSKYYNGIVLTGFFSVAEESMDSLVQSLSDDLLRAAPEKVSVLNLAVSDEENEVLRTTEISQFQRFKHQGFLSNLGNLHIDFEFDTPDERGLQIKIDVNSKPSREAPKEGDFPALLEILRAYIETGSVAGPLMRHLS